MTTITVPRAVLEQALAAMDKATRFMSDSDYVKLNQAIDALRSALAQQEQEPVAWMLTDDSGMRFVSVDRPHPDFVPLYTTPPRREWRGLKEWEINDGRDQLPTEDLCNWSFRQGVYFAEAKLKEKNNG
jgi:hypothetical protein